MAKAKVIMTNGIVCEYEITGYTHWSDGMGIILRTETNYVYVPKECIVDVPEVMYYEP